jgi:hypothetical protein
MDTPGLFWQALESNQVDETCGKSNSPEVEAPQRLSPSVHIRPQNNTTITKSGPRPDQPIHPRVLLSFLPSFLPSFPSFVRPPTPLARTDPTFLPTANNRLRLPAGAQVKLIMPGSLPHPQRKRYLCLQAWKRSEVPFGRLPVRPRAP